MKVVRLLAYAPAAFTPRKYSWYSFLLEAESTPGLIVWPEGLCQWKFPMTPSGIEPATFRLVAPWLNQLRHPVPSHKKSVSYKNEMAAVLWSGFRYTKHNFWCQPVSLVCHYCLDQTEKKHSLEREAKGENKESIFLKLILTYKEAKIWKTGGVKKKEKVPSCTRNQTQNLQEGSVPLLLAFWTSRRPQNSRVSAPIHDLIRSWMNFIHNPPSEI